MPTVADWVSGLKSGDRVALCEGLEQGGRFLRLVTITRISRLDDEDDRPIAYVGELPFNVDGACTYQLLHIEPLEGRTDVYTHLTGNIIETQRETVLTDGDSIERIPRGSR